MIIDDLWTVVGSTNFDNRSFGLNDEVNLATRDVKLASTLERQFHEDLGNSRGISYEEWKRRPLWERAQESLGSVLERQQ
jgi:cardiolipin synthase